MPKVLSGSRFWVIPIALIQHHQLSPLQQLDKGTSDSSVARAVSQTNPTTTSDGAKSLPATLVFLSSLLVVVLDPLTIYGSNSYSFFPCR